MEDFTVESISSIQKKRRCTIDLVASYMNDIYNDLNVLGIHLNNHQRDVFDQYAKKALDLGEEHRFSAWLKALPNGVNASVLLFALAHDGDFQNIIKLTETATAVFGNISGGYRDSLERNGEQVTLKQKDMNVQKAQQQDASTRQHREELMRMLSSLMRTASGQ